MSTNKHIDIICLAISFLTLVITVIFMNGEALGITLAVDDDAGDGQFTANDLNADWDSTGATFITLTGDGGSVKGNGAYFYDGNVHILDAGEYVISGELANGSIIVKAEKNDKIWILLDGVSLHCDDNAAILVEQAKNVFLTLADGTENSISSGGEYTEEAVSTGIDGVIYSRDNLTINGSGSLNVTAEYRHAIVCNDNLAVVGGNMEITSVQDGIHANDSAKFADVNITIHAGDDGITVSNDDETGYIYIESGNINIPTCYEGIEAVDITIAGGVIDIAPTDDGINANGQGSNSVLRITGGDITIINETGRDADGLDSNGDIYISGGNLFISVTDNGGSCAIDYGSENGGVCKIDGGTVLAAGSSSMAEEIDSSSEQCFIMHAISTASAGTEVALKNEDGNLLLSQVVPCSFSCVIISVPQLKMNETCTLLVGDTEEEITVDNSSISNGFGMGGMFGGRGGGMKQSFEGNRDNRQKDFESRDIQGMEPGDGEMPQMPDSEGIPDMQPPTEVSDDNSFDGAQMPEDDRGDGQKGMGDGSRHGGGRFMQDGQNQDWTQGGMPGETSAVTPVTLILVGASILFLLAGILIALIVKH